MIDGKSLTARLVSHLQDNARGGYGRKVRKISDEEIEIFGISFRTHVCRKGNLKQIDVSVRYEPIADLASHLSRLQTKEFWEQESMKHLRQLRKKYDKDIQWGAPMMAEGEYHYKGTFRTENEDRAFFALLDTLIKPVWTMKLYTKQ